ncbi:MAG TPA: hypothetical protein VK717_09570 [Opitutaceae bacterium]|jgi:hypothetical protein|nr:hypothetical protein [Opitutaceae bacterium]
MSDKVKPRRGTDPRVLFMFLGTLFLVPTIFELATGKILSRHGSLIAVRKDSPITYWLFALLSLASTVVMFYIGTRRKGGTK